MSLFTERSIITPRTAYTHHGIYVGDGKVVHYAGLGNGLASGPVEVTNLPTFLCNKGFAIRLHHKALRSDEIVRRAMSRVGEQDYSVFNNNCEHFCSWCVLGVHTSAQVDRATCTSLPSAGVAIGQAARLVVASSGPVVGLSGSGVMSGLAATGSLVGGGAVSGIALLGGVPGAAMASLVNSTVLADNTSLETSERDSRSIGRVASYLGAGAGTVGGIAAVSAAGTTAGLSAAGITSGLAAIGGTVGGGMAAGVCIATAAPAVCAVVGGYGLYKLVRWAKS